MGSKRNRDCAFYQLFLGHEIFCHGLNFTLDRMSVYYRLSKISYRKYFLYYYRYWHVIMTLT